jgi:hypothetical protein
MQAAAPTFPGQSLVRDTAEDAINMALGAYPLVVQTVLLGLLAGFVAWARFGPAAIAPRGTQDPTTRLGAASG